MTTKQRIAELQKEIHDLREWRKKQNQIAENTIMRYRAELERLTLARESATGH